MTGGGFALPGAHDDFSDDEDEGNTLEMSELGQNGPGQRREVEWVGKPHVAGPEWMKMPLLTICMLGLQCVWSIEMGYASPYLLELGLSKSLMSLVFVAGPLSGLIMQPLIGIFADRSKSRFGRRRPFMIIGCIVSVFAMMILGWAREMSHAVGGGQGLAIAIAVFAIYLIDFSINAVMALDRALLVDTLPPSQQEHGNAWAGRMFGTGSLAGFWVGNINLLNIFPFLGKTQLQVLSFLTSVTLMVTHGLTAYSVKERVLFRDNRTSSKTNGWGAVKSIWTNIFLLPPAIASICYAQFFAWIGWFPILFYTSVWVGEIYTREVIAGGRSEDDPDLAADATRAGSRALFLNACVNLFTSIFLPFLVSSSGIKAPTAEQTLRMSSSSPARTHVEGFLGRILLQLDRVRSLIPFPKRFRFQIPLPWLTLIRTWAIGQFMFCFTMMATWGAGSVFWANVIIALNGFCWAVAQWAPFSLLGELILLDTVEPASEHGHVRRVSTSRSVDFRSSRLDLALQDTEDEDFLMKSAQVTDDYVKPEANGRPGHSRGHSSSLEPEHVSDSRPRTPSSLRNSRFPDDDIVDFDGVMDHKGDRRTSSDLKANWPRTSNDDFRRVSLERSAQRNTRRSLQLDTSVRRSLHLDTPNRDALQSFSPKSKPPSSGSSTAEKAGVILGIHNIFVVIPQFLVTFLSSIIFYLMEPTRPSLPESHASPNVPAKGNITLVDSGNEEAPESEVEGLVGKSARLFARATVHALFHDNGKRELEAHVKGGSDSVGLVFRLGGISAAIAGIMCLRMANQWKKDFGSYSTQAAGLGFAPLSQMDDEPAPPRSKTVKTGIHLGLESMETLMSFLAPMKIPHVHIAGTNGKGSVSAMLDSCLREAGMRTGRYNSPHLVTIRDAIVINGKDVSMSIYQKHRNKIDDIIRNNSLENSEFEITTAIAFSVFAEMEPKLDILIIECGMGGLRDATNVLNKSYQLCSVLTAVDLDHQGFLGDTVGAIAREKLGINVEDGLLVVGKQDHAQVMDETIHKVRDSGIELYKADEKPAVVSGSLRDAGPRVIRVNLPGVYDTPESDLDVSLPLAGEHQKDNLATSLTTLQVLRSHRRSLSLLPKLRDLNEQSFKRGISRTIWKGRCSWIQVAYPPPTIGSVSPSIRQVDVLVDGAHNASAASHLRSYVESLHTAPMTPITYIIGLSHSPPKTPASVLHPLLEGCRSVDKVIAVAFSTPIEGMPWIRPVPVDEVRKAAVEAGIWPENVITLTPENGELPGPTLLQALQTLDPRSDGPVIVTGSLYLVADAYRLVV